jgi:hypothetical protein
MVALLSSKNTNKTNATFLVVKGIMHTTLRYPEHKFVGRRVLAINFLISKIDD